MKKLVLLALVLLPAMSFASPFLVCDPPPAEEEVYSYGIYSSGAFVAIVDAETDGSLRYDLAGIQPGKYTFTARAINAWGMSEPSNPYISPAVAGPPAGLKMVP